MEIVKVIVDGLPECCGDCDRYESREKDGGYLHECHFGAGFIKDLGVRLSKCPLVTAEHLFLSPFMDCDGSE